MESATAALHDQPDSHEQSAENDVTNECIITSEEDSPVNLAETGIHRVWRHWTRYIYNINYMQ